MNGSPVTVGKCANRSSRVAFDTSRSFPAASACEQNDWLRDTSRTGAPAVDFVHCRSLSTRVIRANGTPSRSRATRVIRSKRSSGGVSRRCRACTEATRWLSVSPASAGRSGCPSPAGPLPRTSVVPPVGGEGPPVLESPRRRTGFRTHPVGRGGGPVRRGRRVGSRAVERRAVPSRSSPHLVPCRRSHRSPYAMAFALRSGVRYPSASRTPERATRTSGVAARAPAHHLRVAVRRRQYAPRRAELRRVSGRVDVWCRAPRCSTGPAARPPGVDRAPPPARKAP